MTLVWLNDRLVPREEARVPVDDRGFTLGDGLFETMRIYDGVVFRLDAHLERLRRGALRIGIDPPSTISDAVKETVAANRGAGVVRLTLTRGAAPQGLRVRGESKPTLVISAAPYAPDLSKQSRGVTAITASGRLNEHAATAGLKQIGFLQGVLAQREADAAGADDAILLDTPGHVAEAAAANIFVVHGGRLLTPPLTCGVLAGITRAAVCEIAGACGFDAAERILEPGDLRSADELFLTSSLREIVPVVALDGRAIGDGRPGRFTRQLQAAYVELVRAECGGQNDATR